MTILIQRRTRKLPKTAPAAATIDQPVEERTVVSRTASFLSELYTAARDTVVNFLRDCYQHAEAISIMTLASLGLSSLLAELPFILTLPMWFEAVMFIPVISVLAVVVLVNVGTYRAKRRGTYVA